MNERMNLFAHQSISFKQTLDEERTQREALSIKYDEQRVALDEERKQREALSIKYDEQRVTLDEERKQREEDNISFKQTLDEERKQREALSKKYKDLKFREELGAKLILDRYCRRVNQETQSLEVRMSIFLIRILLVVCLMFIFFSLFSWI
jgi:lipopolysaccharide export LptBFGC system permease protein LptF